MSLRCHLKFSYLLAITLAGLHFFALWVVWLTQIYFVVQLLLSFAILCNLSLFLFRYAKRWRESSEQTFSVEKDTVTFFEGEQIKWQGVVSPQTVVTPYFVLLSAKSQHARYVELICFDAMNSDEFRQLRTVLRLA